MIAGRGDFLPVSRFEPGGTFKTGTSAFEKRNLALEIPVWEPDICIQCGKRVFVCPHSVIRSKLFIADTVKNAPPTFKSVPVKSKALGNDLLISYQVAPEDCTGYTLRVQVARSVTATIPSAKPSICIRSRRCAFRSVKTGIFFLQIPAPDRRLLHHNKCRKPCICTL
jgi:pyruvate-ferredoxin/flavodoxin oxidoreductase